MSKILIVEDEESIAELEKDYLELSGFEVEIENNGTDGLERALKEEYDLLILDEYGLHDRHENRLQLIHKVLYSRYDMGKATMIVSNMTLTDLQKDLGDRLWSRFQHDGLSVIECNWADQRVGGGL